MAEETKEPKDGKEVKEEKDMPEWLAPILSSLGSMTGSYMLWIKPLQERMDTLTSQLNDLRIEVKELRHQNKQYEQELKSLYSQSANNLNDSEYLPVKKSIAQGSYLKKRI